MIGDKSRCKTGQSWVDAELGEFLIRVRPNARRFIFRPVDGGFVVTVPAYAVESMLKESIEKLRPRLLEMKAIASQKRIDLTYRIEAECFRTSLMTGDSNQFEARMKPGDLQIFCPHHADFSNTEVQKWLRDTISRALRDTARRKLPNRLEELSRLHGLPYQCVKISSSTTRWGSCSTRKSINLSYHLILLPKHLIDYVLLHELAHTRFMNHGTEFWGLLNQLTNGQARALQKELRNYHASL